MNGQMTGQGIRPPVHSQQHHHHSPHSQHSQYQQQQQHNHHHLHQQQQQQRPVRQNIPSIPQQRYTQQQTTQAVQQPVQQPVHPIQRVPQYQQPIQISRPPSNFVQERISSQQSFETPGSPYSGYAPSAYSQLQQRNGSIPNTQASVQQQHTHSDPAQILERQLRELFDRVDKDGDGALKEDELSTALINNDGTQFKPSTVRLMIRLFDKDGSGIIEFKEFFHLWNYILHWRKTFQRFDIDSNSKISFGEYQSALESFGYRLPTDIVLFIFQRFGEFNSNKPMSLRFDMFVESLVWLLRCTNIFKKFDTQGNGIATISFQDFVHEILSFI